MKKKIETAVQEVFKTTSVVAPSIKNDKTRIRLAAIHCKLGKVNKHEQFGHTVV